MEGFNLRIAMLLYIFRCIMIVIFHYANKRNNSMLILGFLARIIGILEQK